MTDYTDHPSDTQGYGAPDEGALNEHPYGLPSLPRPSEDLFSSGAQDTADESSATAQPSPVPDAAAPGVPSSEDLLPYPAFTSPASTDYLGDSFASLSDAEMTGPAAGFAPEAVQDEGPAALGRPVLDEGSPAPAAGGTFFQADTSADLLRWRAEQLLDEMMIGAVDASAGESMRLPAEPPGGLHRVPDLAASQPIAQPVLRVERLDGMPRIPQAAPTGLRSSGYPASEPVSDQSAPSNGGTTAPRLVSVEHRYAPYVRTAAPPLQPQVTPPNGTAGHYANAAANGYSADGQVVNGHAVHGHTTNGHTTNGHTTNGHASNGSAANGSAAAAALLAEQAVPSIPQLGPVRRSAVVTTGSVAGAMTAGSTRSKYTSLLPRSAPWDAREMEREIGQLSAVIDRHLPSGYESSRRARYLLDKAAGILADDPDRSAEVDYYLGQVRAIVERVRQAVVWSNVYRRRLTLYLAGWGILSVVYLAAGLLYGSELAEWLVGLTGLNPEGLMANHLVAALVAGFAGSLGASVRLLAGLGNVGLKHSLVDRKFGLRGLVLPLIGFLAGLLFYVVLAAAFWAVGVPASLLNWLTLLPAALAFLFGLFQEALYGVRD